jgi:hypothetical protein
MYDLPGNGNITGEGDIKPKNEQDGAGDQISIGLCTGGVGIVPVEKIGKVRLYLKICDVKEAGADEPGT